MTPVQPTYRGRFAPTPTGPLHAGSLVAALGSWLDARAHQGRWIVRIEDVDAPRCPAGTDALILSQLARCGLVSDEPVWRQSQRGPAYAQALGALREAGRVFDCGCSRQTIEAHWLERARPPWPGREQPYPGTCRTGLGGRPARAQRLRVEGCVAWHDRCLGPQQQDVGAVVGDFVLRRADGPWAYQLAVVVDDAAQGITDIVRGEDLADNTPRQILLQRALGLPLPGYLHLPLVLGADGHKLSKQNGALALDLADPLVALADAGRVLGLPPLSASTLAEWLSQAVTAWAGIIAAFASSTQHRSTG